MASKRIQLSRNYKMFRISKENRPVCLEKHKKLKELMEKHGFLRCFPIVGGPLGDDGKRDLKDGQHRLALAEMLGLEFAWVESDVDFDVAEINSSAKVWQVRDYAMKHASNGLNDYVEALAFADAHGLPVGKAFSLLYGTTTFENCKAAFMDGSFKIKDRAWADSVVGIYVPLVSMSPGMRNARFLEACMCVCRVQDFDPKRLLQGANRCREKLVHFGTRDAYLEMLEAIYNYGRAKLTALKTAALMAMRERCPISPPNANGMSA